MYVGGVVAVVVSLVKGDHDDELEWPFQEAITVQILNLKVKTGVGKNLVLHGVTDNSLHTGQAATIYSSVKFVILSNCFQQLQKLMFSNFLQKLVSIRIKKLVIMKLIDYRNQLLDSFNERALQLSLLFYRPGR